VNGLILPHAGEVILDLCKRPTLCTGGREKCANVGQDV
jgi:hypothetical protein